jgi:Rap1a immunity proteins
MKCVIASLTIIILALTGNAQPRENKADVQEFLQTCTSDDPTGPDICLGFVGATLEEVDEELLLRFPPIEIARCAAGMTWGAARQAFINWARRHPENWSLDRLLGVRRALYDTWPCLAWTPHSR